MNIAFFLTPKNEVVYEKATSTMRQVLEKMEYHRYSAIPLIDEKGHYAGTLTEGDLLWTLKNLGITDFRDTEKILIKEIKRKMNVKPVKINSDIESLIELAKAQNFVPVVDDNNIFIGIIKRSDIINYCYNMMFSKSSYSNLFEPAN
ncbi:CBS domain-containing protein [Clostridium sp. DL1XJH146]